MKLIHSWNQFMEIFITTHVNYDHEELCNELEEIRRMRYEPLDDFTCYFEPSFIF